MLIESRKKKKSKKVADSVTYTTGSIQANIDHFNKKHGTYTGLPNVEVQKAAEEAAKAAGTFASQSPDGASSISTDCGACEGASEGGAMGEGLKLREAKRYVRRYYIRPQNIFASNKAEILKSLIEIGDENCSIYTLNNLVDNDDVTKLTNKDIIYYYDNGILYDKNHVKVMDYDLYIKHEEKRDQINPEEVSDKTFSDVYDDRMTDQTVVEELKARRRKNNNKPITESGAFNLSFDDVNAYGVKLIEGVEVDGVCCICGEPIEGYGNNPEPYMSAENGERCCDACNWHFVIPARLRVYAENNNKE